MKLLVLAGALSSVVALSACHPRPQAAVQTGRLDCPETEGGLTRVSMADDGRSCLYRSSEGAEVNLRLMAVETDAYATLAAIEQELQGLGGLEVASATTAVVPAQPPSEERIAEARRVEEQAMADAGSAPESARAEARVAADADPDTESVSVQLPGLKIDANDQDARIKIGPVRIDAGESGATVKVARDVRLRGEALSREKRGVRATYILAGERAPPGYAYVAYEAGGPKAGPLAVAVVTSALDIEGGGIDSDIGKLVRRNGGV